MLDHHIQKSIVEKLKNTDELSFSELKPADIDNKLFTYHLKITIREHFVEKSASGHYRLTPTGQRLWKRIHESADELTKRAHSVLYLVVKSSDQKWLLYSRRTHPMKDKVAFMHATPVITQSAVDRAEAHYLELTGDKQSFSVVGSGFFRNFEGARSGSFIHFTLLLTENAPRSFEIIERDEASYFWVDAIDPKDSKLLSNMPYLLEALAGQNRPFYIDQKIVSSAS